VLADCEGHGWSATGRNHEKQSIFSDYVLNADGSWVDPGFPVPGAWSQDSVGAKTGYTATADAGDGIVLVQEGLVTPAEGGGVLQITAYSEAAIFGLAFWSVGFEVEECPL